MKKIVFSLMLLLYALGGYAQEVEIPETSAQTKEINNIKLSEEAVYADVSCLDETGDDESLAKAKAKSRALLQTYVLEIFSKRMNMTNQDVREIWEVIDKHCQDIVVRRGDMLRIFTYIVKTHLRGEDQDAAAAALSSDKVDSTPASKPTETASAPKPAETAPAPKPAETAPAPKPAETAPAPKPADPAPVQVVVPKLCQSMMEQGNMQTLLRFLQQEKNAQNLMYGNASTMQYKEKCYIVIVDRTTKKIMTILDKGENERVNFVTGKKESFAAYKGGNYSAIFVQEY